MIRRPPRSTLDRSSAASDVYKRQVNELAQRRVQANIYDYGIQGHQFLIVEINNQSFIFDPSLRQFVTNGYCLLYTSPSPRDRTRSRMPSSA